MCDNSDEVAALKNLKECCSLAGWTEAYYQKRLAGHNKEWGAKMKERCADATAGDSAMTTSALPLPERQGWRRKVSLELR